MVDGASARTGKITMTTSILALLVSPFAFLLAGLVVPVLARRYQSFGESTGITLALLMIVSVLFFLITGFLALVVPGIVGLLFFRMALFLFGFGLSAFVLDQADRG